MTDGKTYNKTYDPLANVWRDELGREYIKNEFHPERPLWLDISGVRWELSHQGVRFYLDWSAIRLPQGMIAPLKEVLIEKMRQKSPGYLRSIKNTLEAFQEASMLGWQDFGDITTEDMSHVWEQMEPGYRVLFREMYRSMATLGIGGARMDLAAELKTWKARDEVRLLKAVMRWDERKGALTPSEETELRDALKTPLPDDESDREHAGRIYAWLVLETLKRPSQILSIRADGLKQEPGANGGSDWFVDVEPVKYQTGDSEELWSVTEELALEILEFNKRERVAELQSQFNRLLVWDVPCLFEHGVISTADANFALYDWMKKKGTISPRTKELLRVTPVRLRHTGATRMAFRGVSRDYIQEILEHKSPLSAQSYIDAAGSEIISAIERAGREMGGIFAELNKTYFNGHVSAEIDDKPKVVIPEFTSSPIIVGSCSRDTLKDGVCPNNPLIGCYGGCSSFFAWDNPDPHIRALGYFEKELGRWEAFQSSTTGSENQVAARTVETLQKATESAREILRTIGGGV